MIMSLIMIPIYPLTTNINVTTELYSIYHLRLQFCS